MKKTMEIRLYQTRLVQGPIREGALLCLEDVRGYRGFGEIAPLPQRSRETLQEALAQLQGHKERILSFDWSMDNLFDELTKLSLYPSVQFGLESALLALLDPLPPSTKEVSAFLYGTKEQILKQAKQKQREGYTSAKLKVSHLPQNQAFSLVEQLQSMFSLRIDVNRAWETKESLQFFSAFSLNAFDYVEEPFKNPLDLALFTHPFAVDESFPDFLSLQDLEKLPRLKALVYKPTVQGGLLSLLPLQRWAISRGIQLVLSSSFESSVGLRCIAALADRLSLQAPLGIGTEVCLADHPSW